MEHMTAIDVALIEDDRGFREALGVLIQGTTGFRCVGSWGSVEAALRERPLQTPHVLLLDVNLPGASGPESVPALLEKFPGATVLMLTVFEDRDQIFHSLCNGAAGYLLKKTPPAALLDAIAEADRGGAPMSPEIAKKVVRLFQEFAPRAVPGTDPADEDLTPREIRLLALFAEGCSYREAGKALGISINTVRNHIRSIYEKLHVHSKSEAVTKALRAGLL